MFLKKFGSGERNCIKLSLVFGECSFFSSLGFQLVQKQNVLMKHLCNWGVLSYKGLRQKMTGLRE